MGAVSIASANANIRLLGLGEIEVNHAIQSRYCMSVAHERNLSKVIQRTQQRLSSPVVVFFDGTCYILADGFHRYAAARSVALAHRNNPELNHIWADVRVGTMHDAMVYSAGCNQELCLERSERCIRKAIFMLLDNKEWYESTLKRIAEHVGVDSSTVKRYRSEYCQEKGIDEPDLVRNKRGDFIPSSRKISLVPVEDGGIHHYKVTDSEGNVKRRYLVVPKETPRVMPISNDHIVKLARSNGIKLSREGKEYGVTPYLGVLEGVAKFNKANPKNAIHFIATTTSLEHPDSLAAAIGNVEFFGRVYSFGPTMRYEKVVICRPNTSVRRAINKINEHSNILFMTPEEFIEWARPVED